MVTIRSRRHPDVKRLYKLRTSREAREEEGLCVVYSATLLQEICEINPLKELWLPEGRGVPKGLEAPRVVETSKEIIQKVMGLESASDMIGVACLPQPRERLEGERLLLLDRVSDPGNLGTLLRTALALGWEGVYLTYGCVDPFNDKALRASRCALFNLPFQWGTAEGLREGYSHHQLLVASPRGRAVAPSKPPLILALGNETQGVSGRLSGEEVGIPMDPKMESLNVAIAGGILLYALGTCSRGVALSLGGAGCKDLSLKEERIALAMGDDCKPGDLRPPPLGERYTREHVPH